MPKRRRTSGDGLPVKTAAAAADRFFRAYYRHSTAPDEDTLFDLLNALHSLNDKLGKSADLYGSASFTVLRKLRNLFHHETELLHEVRVIHASDIPAVTSDLAIVCLVPRSLIDQALQGEREKKKEEVRERVISTLKWYGTVADIQPSIFNTAVDVYERLLPLELELASDAYAAFRESYEEEELHGARHHVTGEIACLAGDVDKVLQQLFRQTPRALRS